MMHDGEDYDAMRALGQDLHAERGRSSRLLDEKIQLAKRLLSTLPETAESYHLPCCARCSLRR